MLLYIYILQSIDLHHGHIHLEEILDNPLTKKIVMKTFNAAHLSEYMFDKMRSFNTSQ